MLATNMDDFEYGDFEYKAIFTITGGADVKKFTLAGNRLTFKALVHTSHCHQDSWLRLQ
jgi:hypothetical protein